MRKWRVRVRESVCVTPLMYTSRVTMRKRLKDVRQLLTLAGFPSLDDCSLFNALCNAVEILPSTSDPNAEPSTKSFLCNSGKHFIINLQ